MKEKEFDIFNRYELSKKEEEDISSLKKEFNLVKEDESNYDYLASRRIVVSRDWTKKLLTISFIFNIVSTVLIIASIFMLLIRPSPNYYATTPSGQVLHVKHIK